MSNLVIYKNIAKKANAKQISYLLCIYAQIPEDEISAVASSLPPPQRNGFASCLPRFTLKANVLFLHEKQI